MKKARVPSGPILSTADIMAEPQYQQRGMFQTAAPPGSTQQVHTLAGSAWVPDCACWSCSGAVC